jgi:hypothetical protein
LKAYYQEFSDYNYIKLQPRDPQPNTLNDVIVITGGELAREVRFKLQQKINMTVEAYDGNVGVEDNEVARATGEKVWVDITIPANLSQYIFPLEFEIEAGALSIYPDANPNTNVTTAERNNMPVRTGATIAIDEATGNLKSGNTFRFVRTLSLAEYNDLKAKANGAETVTFTSQFLTNKAANASQVYVANHYFKTGFDIDQNEKGEKEYIGFKNPPRPEVTTLTFKVRGSNLSNSARTVTITSGSASAEITLNRDERTYTSCTYDLTGLGLYEDSVVTFSGSYTGTYDRWTYTGTCTYTTTIGALQNQEITLDFNVECDN